jgi:hypothetical protein
VQDGRRLLEPPGLRGVVGEGRPDVVVLARPGLLGLGECALIASLTQPGTRFPSSSAPSDPDPSGRARSPAQ